MTSNDFFSQCQVMHQKFQRILLADLEHNGDFYGAQIVKFVYPYTSKPLTLDLLFKN